ncbi:MAG: serine peptidase, partial [Betaproteobacteria bacterium]|nr:serine peptidase [Betaproteobacteria bacterium]
MTIRVFKPIDPLYTAQWHFGQIGRLGFGSANTAGIERVWADHTGRGVKVGVWDDGVQATHWDLSANYNASRQMTVGGTMNDGQPLSSDADHGTAVAGLIAAAANGRGGIGVAHGAELTSVRIFGGADDINSAWTRYLQTLDQLGTFDVTNHSYGGTPSFIRDADVDRFEASLATGRGGLGTINVKAAGNDRLDGNGDALDASRATVSVAATTSTGQVTSYSTYGAHILLAAPEAAVTTDRTGTSQGYNGSIDASGDYTNRFSGTSAATPVVAGVAALVLDAAPGLGWRDVQSILALSAQGTGSRYGGSTLNEVFAWKWNGAGNWNGGGLHFSEDYGFGLANAYTATRLAEVWSLMNPLAGTSPNERSASVTVSPNAAIADLQTLRQTFTLTTDLVMDSVNLTVDLAHTYFTDLRISLVSPAGTTLSLYDGTTGDGSTADNGLRYTFGAEGFRGESSAGTWTLVVTDAVSGDAGTLRGVTLKAWGSSASADDQYHYTDEVFAALSAPGQSARATLDDRDGGVDWLDCAAMSRNLVLDLSAGGDCTADGQVFTRLAASTVIENAIGGDGNDRILGNASDNRIAGMRGNDTIDGGAGRDLVVFAGVFADYRVVSSGGKTLVSGTMGEDVLINVEALKFDDRVIDDPTWLA